MPKIIFACCPSTKRTRGVSPLQVMTDLQRYLRGAVNYYALGIPYREINVKDHPPLIDGTLSTWGSGLCYLCSWNS